MYLWEPGNTHSGSKSDSSSSLLTVLSFISAELLISGQHWQTSAYSFERMSFIHHLLIQTSLRTRLGSGLIPFRLAPRSWLRTALSPDSTLWSFHGCNLFLRKLSKQTSYSNFKEVGVWTEESENKLPALLFWPRQLWTLEEWKPTNEQNPFGAERRARRLVRNKFGCVIRVWDCEFRYSVTHFYLQFAKILSHFFLKHKHTHVYKIVPHPKRHWGIDMVIQFKVQ